MEPIYGYRGRPEWRDLKAERARLRNEENTCPAEDGVFAIPSATARRVVLRVLASGGSGWEHVSVSAWTGGRMLGRVPTWEEMCQVKDLFWSGEACVVQYHPPASRYVDHGPVLHLWRPSYAPIPMPPLVMV